MSKETYSDNKGLSIRDKATYKAREKIYKLLESEIPIHDVKSIVDVGCTADREEEASNFFEKLYPDSSRITALSNQDASWMEEVYSGLKFVEGDALCMPFEDGSFDVVFSSAVIEHVGSRENQRKFIAECIRVTGKYVFITTPNKYYPIELHTGLPFIHWLPEKAFRWILSVIGKNFFAAEENLNLLQKKAIISILQELGDMEYTIKTIRFLGFKSNLILVISK